MLILIKIMHNVLIYLLQLFLSNFYLDFDNIYTLILKCSYYTNLGNTTYDSLQLRFCAFDTRMSDRISLHL